LEVEGLDKDNLLKPISVNFSAVVDPV